MKKNTKIIVAVVVILLMVIGGCIYGFVLEKNEVGTLLLRITRRPSRSRRPSRKNRMTPSRKRLRYSRRIPIRRAVSPL